MSTDLVEQADPAQRLAACEAALLSMTEKRDEWQFKANDIGHDGQPILWSDKWSEMLSEYKSELSDRRVAEASLAAERRRVEALEKALADAENVAETFECSLEKYESDRAKDYYESGVTDAAWGIAASINRLRAALSVKQEG